MAWMMQATTILTAVSALLLAALMAIYIRNMRKMRSPFLVGLMLFASLFFVQNLISLYYYATMMAYYVPAVETHVFLLTLLETVAFGILLAMSWE